jgi:hypothetical protein
MSVSRPFILLLNRSIDRAEPLLRAMSDSQSARPRAPGKWSPREIIGHLIDSATNNHGRFLRAVTQKDLVFDGYEQEQWVSIQRYATAPWNDLLTLWALLNRHLARVMSEVPSAAGSRVRDRHNLDQIAWKTVPADQPTSLDYFMQDYVGHLRHHLRQILGSDWDAAEDVHLEGSRIPEDRDRLPGS